MGKRALICASLILLLYFSGAEGYTVVFKSGKMLEGQLISENADSIVFKVDSGLQLSLKKSALDLAKMAELNAASAVPGVQLATTAKPGPVKKEPKVYTNADIPGATQSPVDAAGAEEAGPESQPPAAPTEPGPATEVPLPAAPAMPPAPAAQSTPAAPAMPAAPSRPAIPKSSSAGKQPKVFTNEDVVPAAPNPEPSPLDSPQSQPLPQTAPTTTVDGAAYDKDLKEGAVQIGKTLQDLSALTDGITVNWEVASSTGNDPARSLRDYMTGATATAILNNISQQVNSLQALQAKLASAPAGKEQSYQIFTRAVDSLKAFHSQIQQYDSIQNINLLKSRLTELSSQINSAVEVLQATEPAKKE